MIINLYNQGPTEEEEFIIDLVDQAHETVMLYWQTADPRCVEHLMFLIEEMDRLGFVMTFNGARGLIGARNKKFIKSKSLTMSAGGQA